MAALPASVISQVICRFLPRATAGGASLFLLGLVVGAGIFYWAFGDAPAARPNFPAWLLAIAGVLVGFGTSLATAAPADTAYAGWDDCRSGRLFRW